MARNLRRTRGTIDGFFEKYKNANLKFKRRN